MSIESKNFFQYAKKDRNERGGLKNDLLFTFFNPKLDHVFIDFRS